MVIIIITTTTTTTTTIIIIIITTTTTKIITITLIPENKKLMPIREYPRVNFRLQMSFYKLNNGCSSFGCGGLLGSENGSFFRFSFCRLKSLITKSFVLRLFLLLPRVSPT